MAIAPASTYLKLRYYSHFDPQAQVIIDGGAGEIARRMYLNRLLLFNRKAILSGNPEELYSGLAVSRADIFQPEIVKNMKRAVLSEIEAFWRDMPPIGEYGIGNWLDLMAVRSRFPNLAGFEQARSDSEAVNFMPFSQPSVLNAMFAVPSWQRKNGRMFRRIIDDNYNILARYPLAKDGATYPYRSSTVLGHLWRRAKLKLGRAYHDNTQVNMLRHLSEFIQDTVRSTTVKDYAPYNYARIQGLVDGFYAGNTILAGQLDWWLSFELWRQTVTRKPASIARESPTHTPKR